MTISPLALHFPDPFGDICRRLLHRIEPVVPSHRRKVISMRGDQFLQPLSLLLALVPRFLGRRVLRLLDERADHVRSRLAVVDDAAPLFVVVAVPVLVVLVAVGVSVSIGVGVKFVERVVERVVGAADDADDFAGGVALDFGFRDDGLFGGDDAKGVVLGGCGGCGCGVGFALEVLFNAACGGFQSCEKTKTAVVLCQSLLLVPRKSSHKKHQP